MDIKTPRELKEAQETMKSPGTVVEPEKHHNSELQPPSTNTVITSTLKQEATEDKRKSRNVADFETAQSNQYSETDKAGQRFQDKMEEKGIMEKQDGQFSFNEAQKRGELVDSMSVKYTKKESFFNVV